MYINDYRLNLVLIIFQHLGKTTKILILTIYDMIDTYLLVAFFCPIFMFLGWELCTKNGFEKAERWMRTELLLDLLETPPEKRSERILDLCFYDIQKMNRKGLDKNPKYVAEVLEHLEKRIHRTECIQRDAGNFRALLGKEIWIYRRAFGLMWDTAYSLEDTKMWDIPTVERPMGFEKQIEAVKKCIEKYKEIKGDVGTESGRENSGEDSSVKEEMIEDVDLEKGLGKAT